VKKCGRDESMAALNLCQLRFDISSWFWFGAGKRSSIPKYKKFGIFQRNQVQENLFSKLPNDIYLRNHSVLKDLTGLAPPALKH
jgi:hypothetical protein